MHIALADERKNLSSSIFPTHEPFGLGGKHFKILFFTNVDSLCPVLLNKPSRQEKYGKMSVLQSRNEEGNIFGFLKL